MDYILDKYVEPCVLMTLGFILLQLPMRSWSGGMVDVWRVEWECQESL